MASTLKLVADLLAEIKRRQTAALRDQKTMLDDLKQRRVKFRSPTAA